jgi:hypothetical protein
MPVMVFLGYPPLDADDHRRIVHRAVEAERNAAGLGARWFCHLAQRLFKCFLLARFCFCGCDNKVCPLFSSYLLWLRPVFCRCYSFQCGPGLLPSA